MVLLLLLELVRNRSVFTLVVINSHFSIYAHTASLVCTNASVGFLLCAHCTRVQIGMDYPIFIAVANFSTNSMNACKCIAYECPLNVCLCLCVFILLFWSNSFHLVDVLCFFLCATLLYENPVLDLTHNYDKVTAKTKIYFNDYTQPTQNMGALVKLVCENKTYVDLPYAIHFKCSQHIHNYTIS